jgi:hypothetical protein
MSVGDIVLWYRVWVTPLLLDVLPFHVELRVAASARDA